MYAVMYVKNCVLNHYFNTILQKYANGVNSVMQILKQS